jgi:hypothetical protein
MQFGSNEVKLGIEIPHVDDVGGDEDEDDSFCELSNKSLPTTVTHLGRHDHPTKTPIITAIQRGVMNFTSSPNTSTIEGLRKISTNAEAKAIFFSRNPIPINTQKFKRSDKLERKKEKKKRKTPD